MVGIESKRISFRLVENTDLEFIHKLTSIPEVEQYNTLGVPENKEVTIKMVSNILERNQDIDTGNFCYLLEELTSKKKMGLFGLKLGPKRYKSAEVWFKFLPEFWGKGIATEALLKSIDYGFNKLNLHRIHAGCAVDNLASKRVLEKSGMTLEGRGRKILPLVSGWSDNFEYSILESEFQEKQ